MTRPFAVLSSAFTIDGQSAAFSRRPRHAIFQSYCDAAASAGHHARHFMRASAFQSFEACFFFRLMILLHCFILTWHEVIIDSQIIFWDNTRAAIMPHTNKYFATAAQCRIRNWYSRHMLAVCFTPRIFCRNAAYCSIIGIGMICRLRQGFERFGRRRPTLPLRRQEFRHYFMDELLWWLLEADACWFWEYVSRLILASRYCRNNTPFRAPPIAMQDINFVLFKNNAADIIYDAASDDGLPAAFLDSRWITASIYSRPPRRKEPPTRTHAYLPYWPKFFRWKLYVTFSFSRLRDKCFGEFSQSHI